MFNVNSQAQFKIDLHSHTSCSDGKYTPFELIKRAISVDLSVFAITDHDNMDSIEIVKDVSIPSTMTFIPGIELTTRSCLLDEADFHLVLLFPQMSKGQYKCRQIINKSKLNHLKQLLQDNLYVREQRMRWLIEHLKTQHKLEVEWQEFHEYHLVNAKNRELIQRYSIAKYLVHKQYAKSVQHAFDTYLYQNIPSQYFQLEEMIQLAVNMNAIPILAHPLQYVQISQQLSQCFKIWKGMGLRVIEIEHPAMSPSDKKYLRKIAKQNKFFQSIASDFHNEERSNGWKSDLGNTKGNQLVSLAEKQRLIKYIFTAKK
ncbi:Metal-dependent_phosphoesterase [Hexamita inflata]|uniref:Metal-dependent phosphoesterase n=1 Tax=Hexamita inflata TaxID=28002 RepID=A0AA86P122_9EUKA|nr:Metal-dependent phosphoesterase [Hexamita inflata]